MPLFRKPSRLVAETTSSPAELRTAAALGDVERVRVLMQAGCPFELDSDGQSAVQLAAANGCSQVIRLLIDAGCDLDVQDKLGRSALWRACAGGHAEVARLLCDAACAVDLSDSTDGTPLHEACRHGHVGIVKLLLEAGANIYVREKNGATALHIACRYGTTTCCRVLLQQQCKTNVRDKNDETPLHTAIRFGHAGAAKALLAGGAVLDDRNKNGDTPLHFTSNMGHVKLTKLLLDFGAAVKIRNLQGDTPIDIALRQQYADVAEMLQTAKASASRTKRQHSSVERADHRWARDRSTKIRDRLRAARERGSNWQLLFRDWQPVDDFGAAKSRLRLPVLRKGEQFYIDLAGKVHSAPARGDANVTCYCAPFFHQLAKHNSATQQELIDELDACHEDLSHEISDLRQVTERRLADLHRDLRKRSRRTRNRAAKKSDDCEGASSQRRRSRPHLFRSLSESELETDGERGRLLTTAGKQLADTASNGSDDGYVDRYTSETSMGGAPTNTSASQASEQARVLSSIEKTFQETLRQFNCVDLDDSCTTPTSVSSRPYSVTSNSRSAGSNRRPPTEPAIDDDDDLAADSRRASIYSADNGPQPPSLDSGYGTGLSPSPALFQSPQRQLAAAGSLNNAGTQTLTCGCDDEHEYSELESVRQSGGAPDGRPRPVLTIPPPPRKPLPPLPHAPPRKRLVAPAAIQTNV